MAGPKNTDNRYGDINKILPSEDSEKKDKGRSATRRKRSSPALSVLSKEQTGTRTVDVLKKDREEAERRLEEERTQFAVKEDEYLKLIEDLKQSSGASLSIPMPVSGKDVEFQLQEIDPELIDVSGENERLQEYLDEVSLADILPSIKENKQQKPGTLRPKGDGRYELIEGSRRLKAVKICGYKYLAFVGDVPDEDIRELSIIENKKQDVSHYEKAMAYKRQIDNGEYKSWADLGSEKGISSSQVSRYKAFVDLNPIFVEMMPSPSDIPMYFPETINKISKGDQGDSVLKKAKELAQRRSEHRDNGKEVLSADQIIKELKAASKKSKPKPKERKPVTYQSEDGRISMKHSITYKGAVKLEIDGAKQKDIEAAIEDISKKLKLKAPD